MKQPQFKKALGASAILAGVIAASAPLTARADIYSVEFAAEAASPRPMLSTQPAAFLFAGDVDFASTPAASSDEDRPARRIRRHVESDAPASTSSGKSGKDAKEIIGNDVNFAAPTGPVFAVTTGWDSVYWYKGLDQVKTASLGLNGLVLTPIGVFKYPNVRSTSSGVWDGRVSVEWQGFAFYAGYLQSDDRILPRVNPDAGLKYYGETQLGATYTVGVIKHALDLTVGYNAIFFNDRDFWGHDYQGEAFAKVSYTQIPFITPSFLASYMHSDSGSSGTFSGYFPFVLPRGPVDLTGWWYEARLDGNVTLFSSGDFSVGLNPFVVCGIDGGYNTSGANSFRPYTMEYGVNIPTRLNKNLTLTLHANFSERLVTGLTIPSFWGGASITYKF